MKYLKSWKSLCVLLNAHIHLELIAVPLVPCKSLRNAAEVWDLPQRDLERLWTEKWRICLTFINLTVLIYFIDKFLVIRILIKLCSLKVSSMNQPVLLAMVVFSIHELSLENLHQ